MNIGKQLEPRLVVKRNEYIWSLVAQKYSIREIAGIFNISKSRVHIIIKTMPRGWQSPWHKVKST